MPRLALLALVALAGRPPAPTPALQAVADALADRVGAPADGRSALALAIEADGPALVAPLGSALDAALARRGWSVAALPGGPDVEARARAAGAAWLLRVRGGVVPGGDVALVADLVPTWTSFFLQRRPDVRPAAPRVVQARAAADPGTLLLARPARPPDPSRVAVRPVGRVPGAVLALAVGDPAGDGAPPAILAVTATQAWLLSASGQVLAVRALDPALRRPVRAPAATAAIGDFGAGRLALEVAGDPRAEVLALRAGALEPVATLDAAPLCAGAAGALYGAFAPGEGVLQDVLARSPDPAARPRSDRQRFAVAAAPRPGPIAWAALGTDERLDLLAADLSPALPPLAGIGAGFALADLDGDGTAEVVASTGAPGAPERIRVLVPRASPPLAFESAPVAGAIVAGAGGDLTGDGIDDAVLGAVEARAGGEVETQLLLVTADPREVP